MIYKTIHHTLSDGTRAKFTIIDRIIDGKRFYYSHVINIDLDVYKNLSPAEQESFFGMEITNGKGNKINYSDPERLENDIISKYGDEWLETEI